MWLKLGHDYLNLDQVVRVRFNAGWRNGQQELVAEVEALLKGEIQVFTRYRGAEAQLLEASIQRMTCMEPAPTSAASAPALASPARDTLHDVVI